jgi:flavin-dependent dehydrogenase
LIDDVVIVGAGPAGVVAATLLAREGVRVRLLDRATFPRDKLCGDTINPGTLQALESLGLSHGADGRGLPIEGMLMTGPGGTKVEAHYPSGLRGRSLVRRDFDWALLQSAIAAGVRFEPAVAVRRALVDESGPNKTITGVVAVRNGHEHTMPASVTIAADGRHSTLAFGLGLARHPSQPRRWAVGAYFENAGGMPSVGEMHVRSGRYIGVAHLGSGLSNVCLVKPSTAGDAAFGDPTSLLRSELTRDPFLRERFSVARLVRPPAVLGPLAVDVTPESVPGLILAGDAAGFIDPMTGDGLRFAVRGGALAARATLEALQHGWAGVHERLAAARRREFAAKWRFNRTVRALVASPALVHGATVGARLAPALLRRLMIIAGDCSACGHASPRPCEAEGEHQRASTTTQHALSEVEGRQFAPGVGTRRQ